MSSIAGIVSSSDNDKKGSLLKKCFKQLSTEVMMVQGIL